NGLARRSYVGTGSRRHTERVEGLLRGFPGGEATATRLATGAIGSGWKIDDESPGAGRLVPSRACGPAHRSSARRIPRSRAALIQRNTCDFDAGPWSSMTASQPPSVYEPATLRRNWSLIVRRRIAATTSSATSSPSSERGGLSRDA